VPENYFVVEGREAAAFSHRRDDAPGALHENDRVMAVLSRHRRRQTKHVLGFGLSAIASKPTAET